MRDDHVKIHFRLERDSDDYPPQDVESMWAVPVGNDAYRLDNVPFIVGGISSEDIVRANQQDGVLFFAGLVKAGGHSTVRVLIWSRDETQGVRDELRAKGCHRKEQTSLASWQWTYHRRFGTQRFESS